MNESITDLILGGQADDELDQVLEAVKQRRSILARRSAAKLAGRHRRLRRHDTSPTNGQRNETTQKLEQDWKHAPVAQAADETSASTRSGPGKPDGEASTRPAAAPTMAYIYRIPGCGCVVAACVDESAHQREVEKFKRSREHKGFALAHVTVDEARALPWGWPCEHMKAAGDVRA